MSCVMCIYRHVALVMPSPPLLLVRSPICILQVRQRKTSRELSRTGSDPFPSSPPCLISRFFSFVLCPSWRFAIYGAEIYLAFFFLLNPILKDFCDVVLINQCTMRAAKQKYCVGMRVVTGGSPCILHNNAPLGTWRGMNRESSVHLMM